MVTCGEGIPKIENIIDKIGLLTFGDYNIVSGFSMNNVNYLNNGDAQWLGTGYGTVTMGAWYVYSDGYQNGDVVDTNFYSVRPAVVLNSGIVINCTIGSNIGQCDGTINRPYTIKY